MATRIDRMIARLITQRACLRFAATAIAERPGPVFEIGLGKGRTYDLMRSLLPDREIFAFDKEVHALADCTPDADHLIVGDFRETFADVPARIGAKAVLAHADIGTDDPARDVELVAWLRDRLPPLLAPGCIVLCDRELTPAGAETLPLPDDVADWPYFIYRMPGR